MRRTQRFGGGNTHNTKLLPVRDGKIIDVEVYFGWSIPHKAEPGGFLPILRTKFERTYGGHKL